MEEWCRENENECETEKVHCKEKYRRNEKQWWTWRVYKSETETCCFLSKSGLWTVVHERLYVWLHFVHSFWRVWLILVVRIRECCYYTSTTHYCEWLSLLWLCEELYVDVGHQPTVVESGGKCYVYSDIGPTTSADDEATVRYTHLNTWA